mmetsp:Transcript_21886/g.52075  ORF Transcript_21886/g.52075 Transcript_21886/m.52075 type:complete len:88 (-) Transcript_21886:883-1146(-)
MERIEFLQKHDSTRNPHAIGQNYSTYIKKGEEAKSSCKVLSRKIVFSISVSPSCDRIRFFTTNMISENIRVAGQTCLSQNLIFYTTS